MSRKGTTNYMAPEVFNGNEYGRTADIYSLGLVMYRLLNHNRMPFLPSYPEPITFQNQEMAHFKRISGDPFPYPNEERSPLGDVILKACEFNPQDRFQTPTEFRQALETIFVKSDDTTSTHVSELKNINEEELQSDDSIFEKTVLLDYEPYSSLETTNNNSNPEERVESADSIQDGKTGPDTPPSPEKIPDITQGEQDPNTNKTKKNKLLLIVAAIAVVVLVAVLLVIFLPKGRKAAVQPETAAAGTITLVDYKGQNIDAVRSSLQDSGLTVEVEETDGGETAGTILDQSVPSGSTANKGDHLVLTVSKGNLVTIPAFKNLSKKEVVSSLEALGLSVSVAKDYKYEKGVDAENVVKVVSTVPEEKSQELKEGDLVEKDSSVKVFLCGVPIPKGIVGETEETAQKKLSDLGFKVNTSYDDTTGTYGTVINLLSAKGGKTLDAETILKKGTALKLIVSQYDPQQQPVNTEPVYTPPVTPEPQPAAPDSDITIITID